MSGVQWFMTVTRRGSVVHTVVHAAVVTRRAQSLLPLLAVAGQLKGGPPGDGVSAGLERDGAAWRPGHAPVVC